MTSVVANSGQQSTLLEWENSNHDPSKAPRPAPLSRTGAGFGDAYSLDVSGDVANLLTQIEEQVATGQFSALEAQYTSLASKYAALGQFAASAGDASDHLATALVSLGLVSANAAETALQSLAQDAGHSTTAFLHALAQATQNVQQGGVNNQTAIVETDSGNQAAWASITRQFDLAGRKVAEHYVNDDGSTTDIWFDVNNANDWSRARVDRDASGAVTLQSLLLHDGTTNETQFSSAPNTPVQLTRSYDAQGRKTSETASFSDGSKSATIYDVANAQTWSERTVWTNAAAQTTQERLVGRNTLTTTTTYDVLNQFSWKTHTQLTSAVGQVVVDRFEDDGLLSNAGVTATGPGGFGDVWQLGFVQRGAPAVAYWLGDLETALAGQNYGVVQSRLNSVFFYYNQDIHGRLPNAGRQFVQDLVDLGIVSKTAGENALVTAYNPTVVADPAGAGAALVQALANAATSQQQTRVANGQAPTVLPGGPLVTDAGAPPPPPAQIPLLINGTVSRDGIGGLGDINDLTFVKFGASSVATALQNVETTFVGRGFADITGSLQAALNVYRAAKVNNAVLSQAAQQFVYDLADLGMVSTSEAQTVLTINGDAGLISSLSSYVANRMVSYTPPPPPLPPPGSTIPLLTNGSISSDGPDGFGDAWDLTFTQLAGPSAAWALHDLEDTVGALRYADVTSKLNAAYAYYKGDVGGSHLAQPGQQFARDLTSLGLLSVSNAQSALLALSAQGDAAFLDSLSGAIATERTAHVLSEDPLSNGSVPQSGGLGGYGDPWSLALVKRGAPALAAVLTDAEKGLALAQFTTAQTKLTAAFTYYTIDTNGFTPNPTQQFAHDLTDLGLVSQGAAQTALAALAQDGANGVPNATAKFVQTLVTAAISEQARRLGAPVGNPTVPPPPPPPPIVTVPPPPPPPPSGGGGGNPTSSDLTVTQLATDYLTGLYNTVLGRAPDTDGFGAQRDAFVAYAAVNGIAAAEKQFATQFANSSEGIAYSSALDASAHPAAPPRPDPIGDLATHYISDLYSTVLGRSADAAGLANQVAAFRTYAAANGISSAESTIASQIAHSAEAQQRGSIDGATFLTNLYLDTLGRAPDASGLEFQLNVFNSEVASSGLAAAETDFAAAFANSAEGQAHSAVVQAAANSPPPPPPPPNPAPIAAHATQYLRNLYKTVLGRTDGQINGDLAGLATQVDAFTNYALTNGVRAAQVQFAQTFADSSEATAYSSQLVGISGSEYTAAQGTVTAFYRGIFDREPAAAELQQRMSQYAAARQSGATSTAALAAMQQEFWTSSENVFSAVAPNDTAGFIASLFQKILDRDGSALEVEGTTDQYNAALDAGASIESARSNLAVAFAKSYERTGSADSELSIPPLQLDDVVVQLVPRTTTQNINGTDYSVTTTPTGGVSVGGGGLVSFINSPYPSTNVSMNTGIADLDVYYSGFMARNRQAADASEQVILKTIEGLGSSFGVRAGEGIYTQIVGAYRGQERFPLGKIYDTIVADFTYLLGRNPSNEVMNRLATVFVHEESLGKHANQVQAEMASLIAQSPEAIGRIGTRVLAEYDKVVGGAPDDATLKSLIQSAQSELVLGQNFPAPGNVAEALHVRLARQLDATVAKLDNAMRQGAIPGKIAVAFSGIAGVNAQAADIAVYTDFLNGKINSGMSFKDAVKAMRENIISHTTVPQDATAYLSGLYGSIFNRSPDLDGLGVNETAFIRTIVDGATVNGAKDQFRAAFVGSAESVGKTTTLVRSLYADVLKRTQDQISGDPGVQSQIDAFQAALLAGASRSDLAQQLTQQFYSSSEYLAQQPTTIPGAQSAIQELALRGKLGMFGALEVLASSAPDIAAQQLGLVPGTKTVDGNVFTRTSDDVKVQLRQDVVASISDAFARNDAQGVARALVNGLQSGGDLQVDMAVLVIGDVNLNRDTPINHFVRDYYTLGASLNGSPVNIQNVSDGIVLAAADRILRNGGLFSVAQFITDDIQIGGQLAGGVSAHPAVLMAAAGILPYDKQRLDLSQLGSLDIAKMTASAYYATAQFAIRTIP